MASPVLAPAFAAAAEAAAAAVSKLLALHRALLEQNPAIAEAAEAAEAAAGSGQDAGSRKRGREGEAAAASGCSQASLSQNQVACVGHCCVLAAHGVLAAPARGIGDHAVIGLACLQGNARKMLCRNPSWQAVSKPQSPLCRRRRTCGGWWRRPLRGGRRTAMRPWIAGTGGRRSRGAPPPLDLG